MFSFTEYTVPKAYDLLYDIANTIQKMSAYAIQRCTCISLVWSWLMKTMYEFDLQALKSKTAHDM